MPDIGSPISDQINWHICMLLTAGKCLMCVCVRFFHSFTKLKFMQIIFNPLSYDICRTFKTSNVGVVVVFEINV